MLFLYLNILYSLICFMLHSWSGGAVQVGLRLVRRVELLRGLAGAGPGPNGFGSAVPRRAEGWIGWVRCGSLEMVTARRLCHWWCFHGVKQGLLVTGGHVGGRFMSCEHNHQRPWTVVKPSLSIIVVGPQWQESPTNSATNVPSSASLEALFSTGYACVSRGWWENKQESLVLTTEL